MRLLQARPSTDARSGDRGARRRLQALGTASVTAVVATGAFALVAPVASAAPAPCSNGSSPALGSTVTCTPGTYELTVPNGVASVDLDITAGGGGGAGHPGWAGGDAARVTGSVSTLPTGTVYLKVISGSGGGGAFEGGAASAVIALDASRTVLAKLAIAGAGGGGGAYAAGGNSGVAGGDDLNGGQLATATGGQPGAGATGGAPGTSPQENGYSGTAGASDNPTAATAAAGGAGASDAGNRAGAGGGGYGGGGGGGVNDDNASIGGGGGGGSSLVSNSVSNSSLTIVTGTGAPADLSRTNGLDGSVVLTFNGSATPTAACTDGTTPPLNTRVSCATAGTYTFAVPSGTTSVDLEAAGAGGGGGGSFGTGGDGAKITGQATLPAGTAYVRVITGARGLTGDYARSGGGGSAVYALNASSGLLAKLVIVGGGGGGGLTGNGGNAGQDGTTDTVLAGPGTAANGPTGGLGGTGDGDNAGPGFDGENYDATSLTVAAGGTGDSTGPSGSGGGGYAGGGGGGGHANDDFTVKQAGGGGGGSSYVSPTYVPAAVTAITTDTSGTSGRSSVPGAVALKFNGSAAPTAPGAPTAVTATRGNGQVSLSWTAPGSDGGSAITGYTVTTTPGGSTQGCTSSPCVITGLTNGTPYTFTVVATNAIGDSAASSPSTAVTPATTPGAPTAVTATGANAQAVVSWTAPASTGGSAVTSYTVTSAPGALTCTTTSATSCTVTGLTNGTGYTFTVTATNSVGASVASAPSTAVTPATTPGAPTAVSAAPGSGQATVSWTAPASNGGSAITGYTVTSAPEGKTCTTSGATTCAVPGLTNGTPYTFVVTASNAVGASVASSPSTAVTPAMVPGAPTGVYAVAGDGQASVSFTAPASTGGSAITGYTVTSAPDGLTASCPSSPCVIGSLVNGTAYTFTVVATNAIGNSVASEPSTSVTPVGAPGSPTAVSAVSGNGQATVSWSAPTSDGGSAVTGYAVTSAPGAFTCTPSPATATTCVVTGLTNGTDYTFTVVAINGAGTSQPSSASSTVTPATMPGAPTAVTATATSGRAVVSFSAPASTGGAPVSSYTVVSNPGTVTGTCSVSPCTVTGLTNGTAYTFTVYATNAAGSGSSSAPSAAVTPASEPGLPSAITVGRNGASALISWTAPGTGGSPITGYAVDLGGGLTCTPSPATETSCTVYGLIPIGAYTASVTATNSVGTGTPGTAPVAAAAAPDAPGDVLVTPTSDGNGVVVSWTAPAGNGAAVSSYAVTSDPAGLTCTPGSGGGGSLPTVMLPRITCTISPVTKGTPFTYRVTASNIVGTSPAALSAPYTLSGVPTVPNQPEYTPSRTSMRVFFHAPISDGGSPVLGYRISLNGGGSWSPPLAYTGPASGPYYATVNGLTPDTAYKVRMQAWNANGYGAANVPPATVTTLPLTVPSIPLNTEAVATGVKGQLRATFDLPADQGGTRILGYRISLNGGASWQDLRYGGSAVAGYTGYVDKLASGTVYKVRIQAFNAIGYGGAPRTPVLVAPR